MSRKVAQASSLPPKGSASFQLATGKLASWKLALRKVCKLEACATLLFAAVLAAGAATSGCAEPISIEHVAGQDGFTLDGPLTDLSGLTWAGGDSFFAVSDKRTALLPVTLRINPATGAISSGAFGAPIPVPTKRQDFEGVALVSATGRFYIATEYAPGVISFRPGDATAKTLSLPAVFSKARRGLGMESMTWDSTVRQFWTANEEALAVDGPVSDPNDGSVVRLLQLDADFHPLAQYAWQTESAAMRYGPGNGIADLLLLPNGTLLVLERGFSRFGLRARIYVAETAGATDVSKLASLADAEFTPARKTAIYDEATGFLNFEGLVLGPALEDGSRSLILVADSHGGTHHLFLPLKIRFSAADKVRVTKPRR